jgi:hypothetical protein
VTVSIAEVDCDGKIIINMHTRKDLQGSDSGIFQGNFTLVSFSGETEENHIKIPHWQ